MKVKTPTRKQMMKKASLWYCEWLDRRGIESVRTIIGTNDWRIPDNSRAESFKIFIKDNYL